MSPLPTIVFLLCNTLWVLSSEIKSTSVTFEELDRLDITCDDIDSVPHYSCQERRNEGLSRASDNACHCNSPCSQLGTCCLDSSFQDWNPKTTLGSCRTVESLGTYLLIDKCPSTENSNDAFQTLCEDEQNAKDDFLAWVPVTSLSSNLSYRNYFCFRCHESSDDYTLWNIELSTPVEFKSRRYGEINLTYNKSGGEWFASNGRTDTLHPVSVSIQIPEEVYDFPKTCTKNLISSCSIEWPQDEIREKCSMYMFVIEITKYPYPLYKNPHCALCNFEVVKDYDCVFTYASEPETDYDFDYGFGKSKKLYSFTLVMDFKRGNDGEKVGKTQRCVAGEVWDPFFKKCRELLCVLPGYTIKDGKCKPA